MSPALPRRLVCVLNNNIDLEPHELGRDLGEALATPLRPPIFDRHRAALNPAELAQPLHKCGGPLTLDRRRICAQEPDGWKLPLLRARRERPRCRSAEQRDELASPHACSHLSPRMAPYHAVGGNTAL